MSVVLTVVAVATLALLYVPLALVTVNESLPTRLDSEKLLAVSVAAAVPSYPLVGSLTIDAVTLLAVMCPGALTPGLPVVALRLRRARREVSGDARPARRSSDLHAGAVVRPARLGHRERVAPHQPRQREVARRQRRCGGGVISLGRVVDDRRRHALGRDVPRRAHAWAACSCSPSSPRPP